MSFIEKSRKIYLFHSHKILAFFVTIGGLCLIIFMFILIKNGSELLVTASGSQNL